MKKINVSKWMFLSALTSIACMVCMVVAVPSMSHAGETYKLGLSLAITGPTSDAGNPYAKGVEDYFNYVNDTNMLGEDSIDCIIRDDQYKTNVTKRNFEEYLDTALSFISIIPPAVRLP